MRNIWSVRLARGIGTEEHLECEVSKRNRIRNIWSVRSVRGIGTGTSGV